MSGCAQLFSVSERRSAASWRPIFFSGSAELQLGIPLHAIGILHRLTQENSEKMCIVSGLHEVRKGINRGFEPCLAWWQLEQQCEELSLG